MVIALGVPQRLGFAEPSAGMIVDRKQIQVVQESLVAGVRDESARNVGELRFQLGIAQLVAGAQCPFTSQQLIEAYRERTLLIFQRLTNLRRRRFQVSRWIEIKYSDIPAR